MSEMQDTYPRVKGVSLMRLLLILAAISVCFAVAASIHAAVNHNHFRGIQFIDNSDGHPVAGLGILVEQDGADLPIKQWRTTTASDGRVDMHLDEGQFVVLVDNNCYVPIADQLRRYDQQTWATAVLVKVDFRAEHLGYQPAMWTYDPANIPSTRNDLTVYLSRTHAGGCQYPGEELLAPIPASTVVPTPTPTNSFVTPTPTVTPVPEMREIGN
jgi:hypothetical protein